MKFLRNNSILNNAEISVFFIKVKARFSLVRSHNLHWKTGAMKRNEEVLRKITQPAEFLLSLDNHTRVPLRVFYVVLAKPVGCTSISLGQHVASWARQSRESARASENGKVGIQESETMAEK